MSAIQFLKRKEIDDRKWDECIAYSSNGLPYAFSWYLDVVAENWDALIFDNYEAVMPVVWLRKFRIKCLYQPYYCQQLGVFGNSIGKEIQEEFLDYISKHFSYVNINLNPSSGIISEEYRLKKKKNLLLDLNKGYEFIKKKYSENHRRNIAKALKAKCTFSEETELPHFQKFYLENVNRKKENFKSKHERIFGQLTKTLIENGSAKILSVANQEEKLLAASLTIHHQKRIINIINTSSSEGKNTGASHFLFDKIIQQHTGKKVVLDFEGSSIPTIARFYEGFGAEEELFYNYHTTILRTGRQRFS